MEDLYPQIRALHIGAVIASGSLFAFRGLMWNVFGARWPRSLPVRICSWVVESLLLTAALMLTTIVEQYPFAHGWLTTKVLLLAVYIGLGTVALKPQRRRKVRLVFWIAALGLFLFIVSVARLRHPLGVAAPWLGGG